MFEDSPVSLEDIVAIAAAKQKVKEATSKVDNQVPVPLTDIIAADAWKAMDAALKNKASDDQVNDAVFQEKKAKTDQKKKDIAKMEKEQAAAQKAAEALGTYLKLDNLKFSKMCHYTSCNYRKKLKN